MEANSPSDVIRFGTVTSQIELRRVEFDHPDEQMRYLHYLC